MIDLVPLIIGLFLVAAFLRIDTFFHVVYMLTAVYILSRVWSHASMRQLDAQRDLVNRAFPGEDIRVQLKVRNRGRLPVPWVEIHDALPVEMISPPFYREVISLGPRQERQFEYTLEARKRGYYVIGPLIWRTGDLMGAARQLAATHPAEYIIVYPRVVGLEKLRLPTHSPLAHLPAPAPLFEDPSRVMGVRPYTAGDSPRRIHWTATAATGQLLVKRYQPAIARETLVCLDLDRDDYEIKRLYEATELAIVAAASIANHIIVREGLSAGLSTQARDPLEGKIAQMNAPPRRERDCLMSILELLARAESYNRVDAEAEGALSFPEFLRRRGMALSWGTTVVVVTGAETEQLYDSLVYLRHRGFVVALVLVMPPPTPRSLVGRAQVAGVAVHTIWREEELKTL